MKEKGVFFPIDIVYLWADGADKHFVDEKISIYKKKTKIHINM